MQFTQTFEPVSIEGRPTGTIATVPWDTATFGFGVADFRLGGSPELPINPLVLERALREWCLDHEVKLVGTSVRASEGKSILALEEAGFRYVDSTVGLRWQRFQRTSFQTLGCVLRPASEDEFVLANEIAATAFQHGRYHADPRFPRRLADLRYRHWLERTRRPESTQHVLVFDAHGSFGGFSVVEYEGTTGYFHLMAVNPEVQGLIGAGLGAATMVYLRERGARTVRSKVSTANAAVMNVHLATGARVCDPEVLLHWYAD